MTAPTLMEILRDVLGFGSVARGRAGNSGDELLWLSRWAAPGIRLAVLADSARPPASRRAFAPMVLRDGSRA